MKAVNLSEIKDIIVGLAAIIGAVSALIGLQAWRRQLRGNTHYEVARRLLKAIYKTKRFIQQVRNPVIPAIESYQAIIAKQVEGTFKDIDYEGKVAEAVYAIRWEKLMAIAVELDLELIEAEVLWGKDIRDKVFDLYKSIHELRYAIDRHIAIKAKLKTVTVQENKEIEDFLYGTHDPGNNKFSLRINGLVEEIEKFVKPYLLKN
jgi:hypothetical protein